MNRDHQKAFSLVELLITMGILAILISLAAPSFTQFLETKRLQSSRDLLASHIQQTRTNAITLGRPHQLCGSSDGENCDGEWGSYWLITTVGDSPEILRQQLAPTENLCWAGFASDSIRFHPNGTSWISNGTFSICNANGPHWQLVLNRQGRLKLGTSHNSSCC
ncbi:GspH/FimT family pseudopilin [Pseudomonas punonensis]|uniref:Type II secretion system protein H n=1 Tax=Phytopseudomonas punonensis TaxID=1220495 RepID=A0A1M6YHV2_9GAMM|nr:type IV fimbrial biogenesis protein FimT [Pseudomonas punonensis]